MKRIFIFSLALFLTFASFDSLARGTRYYPERCASHNDNSGRYYANRIYQLKPCQSGSTNQCLFLSHYGKVGSKGYESYAACPYGANWDDYDTDQDGIKNGVDPKPFKPNKDDDKDPVLPNKCKSGITHIYKGSDLELYGASGNKSWFVNDGNACVAATSFTSIDNSNCYTFKLTTTGEDADKSGEPTVDSCKCNDGYLWNDNNTACIQDTSCPQGQVWNPSSSQCEQDTNCPTGQVWNSTTNQCEQDTSCPAGYRWSTVDNGCVVIDDPHTCPAGQVWDSSANQCVKKDSVDNDKLDLDAEKVVEAVVKAANFIEDSNDNNAAAIISQTKASESAVTSAINNASTQITQQAATSSKEIASTIKSTSAETNSLLKDIRDSVGSGSIETYKGGYNGDANDWETRNFGTVIGGFSSKIKQTKIYTGAVGYFNYQFVKTDCPTYSTEIWEDTYIKFDHWCTGDFDWVWKVVRSVLLFLCSVMAFRIGVLS